MELGSSRTSLNYPQSRSRCAEQWGWAASQPRLGGMLSDKPKTIFGQSSDGTNAGTYEWKWISAWGAVNKNKNGTSGWTEIIQSTNEAIKPGENIRIHLCAHNPCVVDWPASKYGGVGPPLHLQPFLPKPDVLSEVAEASGSELPSLAAVESAVAGPSGEAPSPSAELAPEEQAPGVEPPPAVESAVAGPPDEAPSPPMELAPVEPAPGVEPATVLELEVQKLEAETPDCPKKAALKGLQPPAPATPIIHVSDDEGDVNATAVAATAVSAQHKIEATLLALAREIRRPRAYVGYSAFILMGLLKKCQPCVWEGSQFIDLLEVFAPWAKEHCTQKLPLTAIPCALLAKARGSVELVPISDEHPLSKTCHFVAGIEIPGPAVAGETCRFEAFYSSLGVATLPTVCDGDCGLDTMILMLGQPPAFEARKKLRIEISDYLLSRIGEPWMHEIMVACQEVVLHDDDVNLYKSGGTQLKEVPIAPAPAVAEPADEVVADPKDVVTPDGETFAAMRWASGLEDDSNVLSLIRALPKAIIEEQVRLYATPAETAVAETSTKKEKIGLCPNPRHHVRMLVAQRFHLYCQREGIVPDRRMPYGAMRTFMQDNIAWKAKQKAVQAKQIRQWYYTWRASPSNVVAAAAADDTRQGSGKSLLRSRARKRDFERRRAPGAGRPFKAPLIRQELYEWFSSIRYAIDWQQLAADRRSRGKKHLSRFPRAVLKLKVRQFLEEYAYVCLLNGRPVESLTPDTWWFKRWEDEYGLSMRRANRKYVVPRGVLKERLEIHWVIIFRLRLFIFLAFGYDPLIANPDQSPYHHNETGSQNKPTLGVRGGTVPVVEGNSDVKSRWTAFLTTFSRIPAVAGGGGGGGGGAMAWVECMFKAERDGVVDARLQAFLRSRGFPPWFTVTVGPKGSYREQDIIAFLEKHLELWEEGRDWRLLLLDDFGPHKTDNVWALCWSRGYIRVVHGGGATPVGQTPDTDLNEHVRRSYGDKECRLLVEKMRGGQVVPRLAHEECLLLMLEVMSDPELHKQASEGYKKVGQSIDLHGKEDACVCREAGTFWNEETTDKYPSMRPKIDAELAAVADEFRSGGITWCERDVKRLIKPYPARKEVDRVIANLGEDFSHDDIHTLGGEGDDTAVAEGDQEATDSSSDDGDGHDEPAGHVNAAVAGTDEETSAVEGAEIAELESKGVEIVPLSASQADKVHQVKATIASLEATIESLRAIGSVRGVQCIEAELQKERRKQRVLVKESPVVADAFLRLRKAEDQEALVKARLAAEHNKRKREASKAIADRDAAVAELKKTKKDIQEMECIRASKHAIKSYTLDALGTGSHNAGGAKAKRNRMDVLDRLARIKAGLSAGQRNDWPWFRESWDQEMVTEHGEDWAALFAGWVQSVLDDERSNAFSLFVYNETRRVFHDTSALHVPGG